MGKIIDRTIETRIICGIPYAILHGEDLSPVIFVDDINNCYYESLGFDGRDILYSIQYFDNIYKGEKYE